MKLTFDKYHPHSFIKNLAKQLGTTSYTDCLEEIIELSPPIGRGKIVGFIFSDGIGFIVFDCMINEDWVLKFSDTFPAPLQFNFEIEGEIWHSFNNGDIRYHLNPLQGSVTACPSKSTQQFTIPGKRKIVYTSLLIERKRYLQKIDCIIEKLPVKLQTIFSDTTSEKTFFYQGNYSIAAAECINKIIKNEQKGLVRSTYLEGKALELLSRQIRQFTDDLLSPDKQVMLRKYDVDKIKFARDLLIKDIQNPPTIEALAKKAGINQQKLKKGFKAIFETTINRYLRDERLERASLLLLQGTSVKSAALEIGYSNQSHFSRKFKEKYGILPKEYLKSIQTKISKSQDIKY